MNSTADLIGAVTAILLLAPPLVGIAVTYLMIARGVPTSWRLQDVPQPLERLHKSLPLVLFNLSVLSLGAAFALHWVGDKFTLEVKSWWILTLDVLFVIIVEDFWGYWWHRYIHENKYLYKKIHLVHHRIYAPLPAYFIYIHPVEWMVQSLGPAAGVGFLFLIHDKPCGQVLWAVALLRQLHALNTHSGMKSKLLGRIPIFVSTEMHDDHHIHPTKGKYGGVFSIWDKMFGTA